MKILKTLLLTLLLIGGSGSQANPTYGIIPVAQGGGLDTAARHFEKWLKNKHNIDLILMYKPGAETLIGSIEMNNSFDRGVDVIGFHTISNLALVRKQNVNLKPVSALRQYTQALVVRNDLDVTNYDDFISKFASVNYKIGLGSEAHVLTWKQIFKFENITTAQTFVPYKGASHVVRDLLGGHIDVAMIPFELVREHVKSGRLRLLSSSEQLQGFSSVVFSERYPEWLDAGGYCLVLPEKASDKTQAFWIKIITEYLNDPEVLANFKEFNSVAFKIGPVELNRYLEKVDNIR